VLAEAINVSPFSIGPPVKFVQSEIRTKLNVCKRISGYGDDR
jgi:hypothetical protein